MWCSGMGGKNTLKSFGHIENSEEFVKKVYVSE